MSLQIGWPGLMLFAFRLSKPYPDCLETAIASLSNLKFYLLAFPKGIVFHSLKLVAVKEEVFPPLCSDKPKATARN